MPQTAKTTHKKAKTRDETSASLSAIIPEKISTAPEEYVALVITPEVAIEMFGEEAREPVTTNLQHYCNEWLEINRHIKALQIIPPSDNEYLRVFYKVTLGNLEKNKYQCERHIRRLQQCLELLTKKRIFTKPAEYPGYIDVAALKERVDILDVIGRTVELRRSGATYKGKCPFHADRNPSFYIYPSTQRWWCFACSEGGDAISFLIKINHLTFREAITELQTI